MHPGFEAPETYYDIAIIELSKRADYNLSYNDLSEDINRISVSPVCLPANETVSRFKS